VNRKVLWSGRFKKGASDSTLAFTSSLSVDSRLAFHDIMGSLAHAEMLGRKGIIDPGDKDLICEGLRSILVDLDNVGLEFPETMEDIHSAIEVELTQRVGDAGGRLHTARSRNDQVATDLRLFLRDRILDTIDNLVHLQEVLVEMASDHLDTIMPGFTHLQHAQPITLGYHLMAHCMRFQRDASRLMDLFARVNVCPLGSAALAGTTYPIDRSATSSMLAFDAITENSMDAVSDRDMVAEYCFCASLCMTHLSSMCEELIVWSSPEFGFVEVDDEFATGSSIMFQKKNPDVAELIRGRTSGVVGDLTATMIMMKGIPFAYNRDLQEDKEPLFRSSDTLNSSLEIMVLMFMTVRFDVDRMISAAEKGFLNATELADYLVVKGMPFREAHGVVGEIVQSASEDGLRIEDLSLEKLRSHSDLIQDDVWDSLSLSNAVERRTSEGGTSSSSVKAHIAKAMTAIDSQTEFVDSKRYSIEEAYETLRT
jgi:argininosuccinate lyase